MAIDLPEEIKKKIFEISQDIGRKIPLRLVAKENLHLTLQFLGERSPEEAETIKRAVAETVSGYGKIFLSVGNLEFFPPRRPKWIWFKIRGQIDKLTSLHKKIAESLLKSGIKIEDDRFIPHSCMGRCQKRGLRREVRSEVEKIKLKESFFSDKVTVFESRLSSAGPTYFKIAEFRLK